MAAGGANDRLLVSAGPLVYVYGCAGLYSQAYALLIDLAAWLLGFFTLQVYMTT